MAINTAYLASDFVNAVAELPVTVSYGGATFAGLWDDAMRESPLQMAGVLAEIDGTVWFATSATSAPPTRARIGIMHVAATAYTDYRVESVKTAADGVSYEVKVAVWNRT